MNTQIEFGIESPIFPSPKAIKGRGSRANIPGRFEIRQVELDADNEVVAAPTTEFRMETARSIITRNASPDVPFTLSVNPYRGCEQGCIYCFARPSHAYLDLSPGLDFETKISVKHNAAALFEQELRQPGYRCEPIALGINTDAYQPAEKTQEISRQILDVARQFKQPISIVTKSALILRDKDLLAEMARENLIHVAVSLTTLDNRLKRILEPRAADASSRLRVISELRAAGVPVSVLIAPVIPLINEREMEQIIEAASDAGATSVAYILLRLPNEVAPLFIDWLYQHFPQRAGHILARIKDMRGGQLYNSRFGERMKGQGIFAELISQRFHLAAKKFGMNIRSSEPLDCSQFSPPIQAGDQLSLL
jgi:DNA repair photolyase